MRHRKISIFLLIAFIGLFAGTGSLHAQIVTLDADGPGNTYELINSVLAPGYDVVEHPECAHPEFGRHIREVWDTTLNRYVFEFYMHVTPDNDRCINFDRQRMEIKTYDQSPAILKGVKGETVVYRWKFRLPSGFRPSASFTHLHQIKAVGGDDDDPVFTLTARKGSPNKMELIHNNTTKAAVVNLSLFEGNWVEVTERVKIDPENGAYSIEIKNAVTGVPILSYSSPKLMTIRPDNTFIRPKWGIYRSLLNAQDLRDEAVRFAGFSIREEASSSSGIIDNGGSMLRLYPNPTSGLTRIEFPGSDHGRFKLDVFNACGSRMASFDHFHENRGVFRGFYDFSFLPEGTYFAVVSSLNGKKTTKFLLTNSEKN